MSYSMSAGWWCVWEEDGHSPDSKRILGGDHKDFTCPSQLIIIPESWLGNEIYWHESIKLKSEFETWKEHNFSHHILYFLVQAVLEVGISYASLFVKLQATSGLVLKIFPSWLNCSFFKTAWSNLFSNYSKYLSLKCFKLLCGFIPTCCLLQSLWRQIF